MPGTGRLLDPFDTCDDGEEYSWGRSRSRENRRDKRPNGATRAAHADEADGEVFVAHEKFGHINAADERGVELEKYARTRAAERDAALGLARTVSLVLNLGSSARDAGGLATEVDYCALLGIRNIRVDHCPQVCEIGVSLSPLIRFLIVASDELPMVHYANSTPRHMVCVWTLPRVGP